MNRSINTIKTGTFLAGRSVVRGNKAVLGLTVLMLALVYINLLFFPALLSGLVKTINDKQIAIGTSHFVLQPTDGNSSISNASALKREVKRAEQVSAVTSRISLGAELEYQGQISTYGLYAVDPKEYPEVFDLSPYMVEGKFLEPGDLDKIVLGIQVAGADNEAIELYQSSLQHVHAGDRVTIRAGETEVEMTVKGIFNSGTVQNDLRSYISDDALFSVLPERRDTATSIHVKMVEGYNAERAENALGELSTKSRPFTVLAWEELAGILKSVTGTFESIIRVIQGVALAVGGITVFVVTYVDIVNKRRQIELQRNLGIGTGAIVLSNALRAVAMSVIGIGVGVLLYLFVITPLEAAYPFTFPFGEALLVTSVSSFFVMGGWLVAVSLLASTAPKV